MRVPILFGVLISAFVVVSLLSTEPLKTVPHDEDKMSFTSVEESLPPQSKKVGFHKSPSQKTDQTQSPQATEVTKLTKNQIRYMTGPQYMRKFIALNKFVLKNQEQTQALRRELMSEENTHKALEDLHKKNQKFDSILEKDRRMAIDFLSQAITISDNPHRDQIADRLARYLINHSSDKTMDQGAKRALAGDQIEVFRTLQQSHPHLAQEIMSELQGTKKIKLLQYALKKK